MPFHPKTWADLPREAEPGRMRRTAEGRYVADDGPPSPLDLVACPGCGRVTHADAIEDLRGIPGTVVRGRDIEWGCDGCRSRLVREGGWKHSDLVEAQGAPPEHVHEHRIREHAHEQRRADARASRPHNRVEAHAAARKALAHLAPKENQS